MASDGVARFAESRVGQVLRGKYRLERVLGVGGMGAVYAATHRNRKRFALKMLHPELSCVEHIRTRFLREGYVANSVNHPGAVTVLDDDVAEDGSAFLVMELLEGKSFEALWEDWGRALPPETLIALFDQVLDVLVAAHEQAIVHRDLKPANLFLTHAGVVKVLDFGIARLLDAQGGGGTQTGAPLGTPAFMAPEQARGNTAELDARTDLWAVGATLFVLLSGRFVHQGDNPHQLLMSAATRQAPTLRSVEPGVPAAIAAVVDRALAFEKAGRFANALQMRQALLSAGSHALGKDLQSIASMTAASLAETVFRATNRTSVVLAAPKISVIPTAPPALSESAAVPVVHKTHAPHELTPGSNPSSLAKYGVAALVVGLTIAVVLLAWRRDREDPSPGGVSSGATGTVAVGGATPLGNPPASNGEPSASAERRTTSAASARHALGIPRGTTSARPPPALCARLLERQSLGETLTSAERTAFLQQCRQ